MNEFASSKLTAGMSNFIVKNVSNPAKLIRIFNYPIPHDTSRNLMDIEGISEESIRASLLKGEINHKLRTGDIVIVSSDVELLSFNAEQSQFYQNNGIAETTSTPFTQNAHETVKQLIHFLSDGGPAGGFMSGAYRITIGQPFPTAIVWYTDNSMSTKIVEKLIIYNNNHIPVNITWHIYSSDGFTIVQTITDSIMYANNIIETARTRSITEFE